MLSCLCRAFSCTVYSFRVIVATAVCSVSTLATTPAASTPLPEPVTEAATTPRADILQWSARWSANVRSSARALHSGRSGTALKLRAAVASLCRLWLVPLRERPSHQCGRWGES
eukprot:1518580-Rhodomonas_salina.2